MRVDPLESSKGLGELIREEMRVSDKELSGIDRPDRTKDVSNQDVSKFFSYFRKKVEKFQELFRGELKFEIDRDINMIIVKIKDKDTGELIRQIPPEVVVKLARALDEFLGLLMDERV